MAVENTSESAAYYGNKTPKLILSCTKEWRKAAVIPEV